MDATYQMMDNDLLVNYSTSKALIDFYEYKLGDVAKLIRTNNEFMDKLHQMSQLNPQISTMEITPDEKNRKKLEDIVRSNSSSLGISLMYARTFRLTKIVR